MRSPRSIAIVGGGIFGVTVAVKLAESGYRVDLFEQHDDILLAASGINQYRLHRGYHYPRSLETVRSCRDTERQFRAMYGGAVLDDDEHYYAISARESLTLPEPFLALCRAERLAYEVSWSRVLRKDAVSLCVKVREGLLDIERLRSICWHRLQRARVNVVLSTHVQQADLKPYDRIVVATYAATNALLTAFPEDQREYQFELCEKPVVRLPASFRGMSVVVLDGQFCCVDPLGRTGLFILGNVVHGVHQSQIGTMPSIEEPYASLLNRGVIRNPPVSHIRRFISSGAEFFHGIERAEHVGSMFTVRTVLPYKEVTDERPTLVNQIGDRIITLLSGKIASCVEAANQVAKIVGHASADQPRPLVTTRVRNQGHCVG